MILVAIWCVTLSNGDWYKVFATNATQAVRLVASLHYETLPFAEFQQEYRPTVSRTPDSETFQANDPEHGQKTWTARRWSQGRRPGPFLSNTYSD